MIPIAPQTRMCGPVEIVFTMAEIDGRGLSVGYRAINGHLLAAAVVCVDDASAVTAEAQRVANASGGQVTPDAVCATFLELHLPTEAACRQALADQRFKKRGAGEDDGGAEPQPWPDPLGEAAWYGLAGDIARAIEPHTEGDPVAVLVTLLVFLGNLMGHGPHMRISGTRHTTNEFAVIVGASAQARKGSSLGHPVQFMRLLDPIWSKTRKLSGLSTGEGLVSNVRDPTTGADKDGGEIVVDAGETDKRLMLVESEFAAVLRMGQREGNTQTTYVRQAWDDGNLGVMTRRNPLIATDAHISLLGHATRQDLDACLAEVDTWNGYVNRILWIPARRSKLLSRGGGDPHFAPLLQRAHTVISVAREMGEVAWGDEAGAVWDTIYGPLTRERSGRLAAATARAEAHVVRLAVLYAALDMTDVIEMAHLSAALALWRYAEQGARWLFGDDGAADEAATIIEALRVAGDAGLTRSALYALFDRHITKDTMSAALEQLLTSGRIVQRKLASPSGKGGRPAYVYTLTKGAS